MQIGAERCRASAHAPLEEDKLTLLVLDPSTSTETLRFALSNNSSSGPASWPRIIKHDLNSLSKIPQYQLVYVDPSRGVLPLAQRNALKVVAAVESYDK